jgi:hypothetical protein
MERTEYFSRKQQAFQRSDTTSFKDPLLNGVSAAPLPHVRMASMSVLLMTTFITRMMGGGAK